MIKFRQPIAIGIAIAFFITVSMPAGVSAITVQEENELAREFLQAVNQQYKIIKDPAIADYINKIGRRVVAELPQQPFTYHFYVIEQDTYNAFAGPAGHIFVFSGLFEALDHEGELAALLAHEIAHASCRHISEMIESSKKTSLGTLAGVVAGILVGLGGASAVGSAITIGSMAAGESAALAYTREKEMQADQIGREYLQKAGYDLHSMLSLLKTIRSQEWFGTDQIPTYLRTHPATEDRLTYLNNTLSNKPAPPPKNTYEFKRARIRVSALYGNPRESLRQFQHSVKTQPEDPMAHYGYGLALERNGNPRAAAEHLETAYHAYASDPYMTEDLGRVYFLNGDYEKALEFLKKAAQEVKNGPDSRLYLGRTQLAMGRTEAATDTFSRLADAHPDYLPALYYLGKSYSEQDDPGNAHYYLGLYHMGKKDPKNAAFHFKQALKTITDPEKVKKIKGLLDKL
ncbi:MAG: M48 family metalloprotease [Desulfobacterales bacterium]|nr:M48 family metalloprotease [Desulfobacterales bacterium]